MHKCILITILDNGIIDSNIKIDLDFLCLTSSLIDLPINYGRNDIDMFNTKHIFNWKELKRVMKCSLGIIGQPSNIIHKSSGR